MTPLLRTLALTALVALVAGFAGVWLGSAFFRPPQIAQEPFLRETVFTVVKRDMSLSETQERRVTEIEDNYLRERAQIRLRISAGNAKLARAMVEDMDYGPMTKAATDEVSSAIADLQRATIVYALTVRSVLTTEQQHIFDDRIIAALTNEAP